jgi:hypothetical protein
MANFAGGHDAYFIQQGLTQILTVTSATGTSTTAFGTQTRAVQVLVLGNVSSFAAVFCKVYNIGETSQATSLVDCPVPLNWVQVLKVNPGQRMGLISGDAAASYRAHITELSD